MSTAAEKAAARRAALLNRGGDRLSKLATTARGEDAAYLRDDRRASFTAFLGEDAIPSAPMTPPRPLSVPPASIERMSSSPSPGPAARSREPTPLRAAQHFNDTYESNRQATDGFPDPDDMQLPPQLAQLLAGAGFPGAAGAAGDNPLAALMGPGFLPPGAGMGGMPETQEPQPARKTLLQRILPFLHFVAVLGLVLYAAFSQSVHSTSPEQRETTWRNLATRRDDSENDVAVLPTNFFWIFITIELMLHSLRVFTRNNAVQLPWIVQMVLPMAPAGIQSAVMNGARYYAMFGMLLNDLAVLIFALGVVVWLKSS